MKITIKSIFVKGVHTAEMFNKKMAQNKQKQFN